MRKYKSDKYKQIEKELIKKKLNIKNDSSEYSNILKNGKSKKADETINIIRNL